MKESIADPGDFWAALNFWIFFAVGHPLLQSILWIIDFLHGTPGPMLADLVPALFLAGNAVVIFAVSACVKGNSKRSQYLSAFISYVGASLDGPAGLWDFNLALDDSYAGKVVKGCPTNDEECDRKAWMTLTLPNIKDFGMNTSFMIGPNSKKFMIPPWILKSQNMVRDGLTISL